MNKNRTMEKKDLRIVYMGTPEFAVESLKRLVEGGYNVVHIFQALTHSFFITYDGLESRYGPFDLRAVEDYCVGLVAGEIAEHIVTFRLCRYDEIR